MSGRGRESSERGRRSLLQERAHGLRLAKDCVHGSSFEAYACLMGQLGSILRGHDRGSIREGRK